MLVVLDTGEGEGVLPEYDGVPNAQGVRLAFLPTLVVEKRPWDEREVPRPWRDRRDAVEQLSPQPCRASQTQAEGVLDIGGGDVFAPTQEDWSCSCLGG